MSAVEFDCVVLNGTVVTAADTGRYDIGIKKGKVAVLAASGSLKDSKASVILDAEGAYVTVILLFFPMRSDVDGLC